MADYKLVYEKDENIYGSETGIPALKEDGTVDIDTDAFIVERANLEGHKLVYGKKVDNKMVVYVSESGIPSEEDKTIAEVQEQAEKRAACGKEDGHDFIDEKGATDEDGNEIGDDKCDECGGDEPVEDEE